MDVVNGQSWSYDANGNVQRSPASGGGTYTYVPGTNILAALGTGEHFSANPQGSVTADTVTGGVAWAYGYNGPQRLAQVAMNGVVQARYAYDGVGRRGSKTIGSTVTNYVYGMSGHLLAEHDVNGHMLTENIWLGGTKLAEVDAAGNLYYVHGDRLGTPQRLTNAGAGLAWDASYQPYGAATIAAGSGLPQAQRLPGQYYDAESGLHQNGARDYSPVVGRYLESDPIGLASGMNTYRYAQESARESVSLS